jgi:hypothetical protein
MEIISGILERPIRREFLAATGEFVVNYAVGIWFDGGSHLFAVVYRNEQRAT